MHTSKASIHYHRVVRACITKSRVARKRGPAAAAELGERHRHVQMGVSGVGKRNWRELRLGLPPMFRTPSTLTHMYTASGETTSPRSGYLLSSLIPLNPHRRRINPSTKSATRAKQMPLHATGNYLALAAQSGGLGVFLPHSPDQSSVAQVVGKTRSSSRGHGRVSPASMEGSNA
ncbi:hypothetical protein BU17DRAFT_89701 [Hysterangium stoloniferum]|nr:hypothetical protein BU17DRAFT_89701 [Hysterangium stoloniferum]